MTGGSRPPCGHLRPMPQGFAGGKNVVLQISFFRQIGEIIADLLYLAARIGRSQIHFNAALDVLIVGLVHPRGQIDQVIDSQFFEYLFIAGPVLERPFDFASKTSARSFFSPARGWCAHFQ